MRRRPKPDRLVVCVRNDEYPVDLELRKIYRAVPDRKAEAHGLVRVIDESGEDYLFPADYFRPIRVPRALREALPFDAEGVTGTGQRARPKAARVRGLRRGAARSSSTAPAGR
jgi:hypothetical protein